jgi:hypothetical protein
MFLKTLQEQGDEEQQKLFTHPAENVSFQFPV